MKRGRSDLIGYSDKVDEFRKERPALLKSH